MKKLELQKEQIQKIKKTLKAVAHYLLITVVMVACFTIGYYFNRIKEYTQVNKPEFIKRSEVTVAVDENSNFLIISKTDGTYIMLEDSVGRAIFDMYARSIWTQHQETPNEVIKK